MNSVALGFEADGGAVGEARSVLGDESLAFPQSEARQIPGPGFATDFGGPDVGGQRGCGSLQREKVVNGAELAPQRRGTFCDCVKHGDAAAVGGDPGGAVECPRGVGEFEGGPVTVS